MVHILFTGAFQTRLVREFLPAIIFVSTIIHPCLAQEPSNQSVFDGAWDGKFKDNENRSGQGKYLFGKEKDYRWEVTVSWIDMDGATREMPVQGERLGPDALRLQGRYKDTTYWYVGRMESQDGPLVLHYVSVDAKTGKSGSGVSTLTRSK